MEIKTLKKNNLYYNFFKNRKKKGNKTYLS